MEKQFPAQMVILDANIRMDRETGYICVTDIANLKPGGGKEDIGNWLRNANTVAFFHEWELKHNPSFKGVEFDTFKQRSGLNAFRLSAGELVNAGGTGIFVRRGRYGGTYCTVDWAIHFANWLSPKFYVETINAYRNMLELTHGQYASYKRFSRELAAENYQLVSSSAIKSIPEEAMPDPLFKKRVAAVEADILNLAMWSMTAEQWRQNHPQKNAKLNMRDFATPEELKTIAALEIIINEMHENQFTSEEKLDRLTSKADQMIHHYCNDEGKRAILELAQHKRGWGRFTFDQPW